jgi:hypothetical protein
LIVWWNLWSKQSVAKAEAPTVRKRKAAGMSLSPANRGIARLKLGIRTLKMVGKKVQFLTKILSRPQLRTI